MQRSIALGAASVAAVVPLLLVASCYLGPVEPESATLSNEPADGGAASPDGGASNEGHAAGLPCDVEKLLTSRCAACHSTPLKAPVRLVTYEDLVAKSKSDPARTLAEIAVGRMRSTSSPMPPRPNASASGSEIGAVEKWIAAGYPHGSCGSTAGDAGGAQDAAPAQIVCTSGLTWSSGKKGTSMNPGRACITCHDAQTDKGSIVEIGGTVYPTFHEPDLCFGVDGTRTSAQVVITDAIGQTITLPVGPTGNFAKLLGGTPVRTPFRAKVVSDGVERAMATPQTSGDCNGCHTANGANGAPGRITLP
jgi:cytochrome c553